MKVIQAVPVRVRFRPGADGVYDWLSFGEEPEPDDIVQVNEMVIEVEVPDEED